MHPSIYFKNSAIWFNNAASQSISTQSLLGLQDKSSLVFNYPVQFEALEETYKDPQQNPFTNILMNLRTVSQKMFGKSWS